MESGVGNRMKEVLVGRGKSEEQGEEGKLGKTRVSIYSTSLVNTQCGGGREDVEGKSVVEHQLRGVKPDVMEKYVGLFSIRGYSSKKNIKASIREEQ